MSKIVSFILVVLFLSIAIANAASASGKNFAATGTPGTSPANVVIYAINDGIADVTKDSLPTGKACSFGPYGVCIDKSRPMFKTVQMHYPAATMATGDTIYVDYQLIPTLNIADTSATWTALDTVNGAGAANIAKFGNSVDISAKIATGIVFRAVAKDAAGTGVRITKKIRACFLESFTAYVNTKGVF